MELGNMDSKSKQKVVVVKLVQKQGILYVYDPKKKRIKLKFCVLRGLNFQYWKNMKDFKHDKPSHGTIPLSYGCTIEPVGKKMGKAFTIKILSDGVKSAIWAKGADEQNGWIEALRKATTKPYVPPPKPKAVASKSQHNSDQRITITMPGQQGNMSQQMMQQQMMQQQLYQQTQLQKQMYQQQLDAQQAEFQRQLDALQNGSNTTTTNTVVPIMAPTVMGSLSDMNTNMGNLSVNNTQGMQANSPYHSPMMQRNTLSDPTLQANSPYSSPMMQRNTLSDPTLQANSPYSSPMMQRNNLSNPNVPMNNLSNPNVPMNNLSNPNVPMNNLSNSPYHSPSLARANNSPMLNQVGDLSGNTMGQQSPMFPPHNTNTSFHNSNMPSAPQLVKQNSNPPMYQTIEEKNKNTMSGFPNYSPPSNN